MTSALFRRSPHNYELLPRSSIESDDSTPPQSVILTPTWLHRLRGRIPGVNKLSSPSTYAHYVTPRRRKRSVLRIVYYSIFSIPYICLFLVLFASFFFPSYTIRPAHYEDLRQRALLTTAPGRANPYGEKVFIAASLYENEGHLTSGPWGKSVLDLIDLLGPQNVHLSVYENDPDPVTRQSLIDFRRKAPCNSTVRFDSLDLSTLPRVTLPTGETRVKRITFLAEVRNRALEPMDTAGVKFDKLLYINDVNFDPIEAAQLLFATNVDSTGRANYGAACAVDFINPFKFYDRFATRDYDGYNLGIPFFPWFTSAGSAVSRSDVISGTDAVRVRSCWGGMVAYEASWFQDQAQFEKKPSESTTTSVSSASADVSPALPPLRFRYAEDPYWEASECCLINADLAYRRTGQGFPAETGVYMNPFIRVAYDTKTLSWLGIVRRPERLYSLIHDILSTIVGFPNFNPRQFEEPGKPVHDLVWRFDDPNPGVSTNGTALPGHFVNITRTGTPGSYCGGTNLLVMNEGPEDGEGKWRKIMVPRPPGDKQQ